MYVSTRQCHETADLANEFLGIHGACKFKSHWNTESKPLCLVTLLLYLSNLALALVSDSFGLIRFWKILRFRCRFRCKLVVEENVSIFSGASANFPSRRVFKDKVVISHDNLIHG